MNRIVLIAAFVLGLVTVAWVGAGFLASSWLALTVTCLIGLVFILGALEIRRFRANTQSLEQALGRLPSEGADTLDNWWPSLPQPLQQPVKARIRGERSPMPGLAMTPYFIGLLVMLGMLGTFLGMVVTFKGAVLALEGSADLAAMRAALAAPIKGLGLSFGTSVAGVATSALLGLMATIARRERSASLRQLEQLIATQLRTHSIGHQRQLTYQALQQQAAVLPVVAEQLQSLMSKIEERGQQLDQQLMDRQKEFHQSTSDAYTQLARSVEQSLRQTLVDAGRTAGESIRPVVESAMAQVASESQRLHAQVSEAVQSQLLGLGQQFESTTRAVSQAWEASVGAQAKVNETLVGQLDISLQQFAQRFAEQSGALLAQVEATTGHQAAQWQQAQDRQSAEGQALISQLGQTLTGFGEQFGTHSQVLLGRFDEHAKGLESAWQQTLERHGQSQQALVLRLDESAKAIGDAFSERSAQLLEQLRHEAQLSQQSQSEAEAQRLATWTQALQSVAEGLGQQWQAAGERSLAQQQALSDALHQTAGILTRTASEQAEKASRDVARLMEQSDALVQARAESESRWVEDHARRMDAMASAWQEQLVALRDAEVSRAATSAEQLGRLHGDLVQQLNALREDEAARGDAAAHRLGELQTAVAAHLASLGAALEAPMTRLLETASEAPKAAAEVIARLREEMSHLTERDNQALAEREQLMGSISGLLDGVQSATAGQREAIETLVSSASAVLNQVTEQFSGTLGAQATRSEAVAAQVAGSAADLAALGDAFQRGVEVFGAANEKLVSSLQRMELAIGQSMERSDEQLQYYVQQAREVIDLSISAQQGIVEDLRQLRVVAEADAMAREESAA